MACAVLFAIPFVLVVWSENLSEAPRFIDDNRICYTRTRGWIVLVPALMAAAIKDASRSFLQKMNKDGRVAIIEHMVERRAPIETSFGGAFRFWPGPNGEVALSPVVGSVESPNFAKVLFEKDLLKFRGVG